MKSFKGKKLLILGGSKISCEIVNQAKKMGIYTIVTDWYEISKSPAKHIADKSFQVSTSDIEAVVELIKEESIDGVLTGYTDSTLPYYAEICEKAGLPCYGTKDHFELFTDKSKYKSLLREYNIPTVEEYDYEEEKENNFSNVEFPVLVKPVDGSGARGVVICNDMIELKSGIEKALNHSESKKILIERYVIGNEVSVFWLFDNGNVYLSGMGDRHVKDTTFESIPLPVAYTYPSIHLNNYLDEIYPKVKNMFESVGITNGILFMQCILEEGIPLIYDIGYRLTGTLEYKQQEEIQGFNSLEMLINYALTGSMGINEEHKVTANWEQYSANITYLIKPGTIKKIKGISLLKESPEVIDWYESYEINNEIPVSAIGTLKQIFIRAFIKSESLQVLYENIFRINKYIKVIDDSGKNMIIPGLLREDVGDEYLSD